MVNLRWFEGVTFLFKCRRVKQLFSSITDTVSFLHIINEIIEVFSQQEDAIIEVQKDEKV